MCKEKTIKRIVSVVSAAAMMMTSWLSASSAQYAQKVTAAPQPAVGQTANPVIWADVPDPDIIRVGDTYYMVSTTMYFSPGVPVMKSKDLVSWEICSYVYDILADAPKQNLENGQNDYSHGSWAASLRYHEGNFYVFFGSYGTNKSYIYKTSDIESGNWTKSEINGMYHDASMLFDDDGRNYLVYGGDGNIKIKELNSSMTGFANGAMERTIVKTGLSGLSGEGSHIMKIGGYYYIFLIAWPNGHGRLELCYRSKSLDGQFEGKTILDSGLGTYGSGTAQGGIVDTPDGDWYGLVFQDHGSVGRIPVLVPVTWTDDWPVMGVNGKAPVLLNIPGNHTGTKLAESDDFSYDENKLKLVWQWNHNPDNRYWSVTERPGFLRLTNGHTAKSIMDARNTLTQRTEGPSCAGTVLLDTKGMKNGDCAGISAFQFNYGNVGVRVTDSGEKKIYMASNGGYSSNASVSDSRDKIVEEVPLQGDTVYLKTDFKFNTVDSSFNVSNNIDKVGFYYSYDGASWKKIGSDISMTYDLKLFTGYRNALYSYSTSSTGGYADFDEFIYEREAWNEPQVIEADENGFFFKDSFDSSKGNWDGRGGASVSLSKFGSESCMYVSDRTAAWHGMTKQISSAAFEPGKTYSFGAVLGFDEGPDEALMRMTLQYNDMTEDEVKYIHIDEKNAKKGEFVSLCDPSFTIPENASDMYIILETAEDETLSFSVDEVYGANEGTVSDKISSFYSKVIPGDINNDGIISIVDLCLMKYGVLNGFDSKSAEAAADMNNDKKTGAADIVYLVDVLLGRL